ncbi:hypothetical protein ACTXT7_005717 [Hymenolepis weldensis]
MKEKSVLLKSLALKGNLSESLNFTRSSFENVLNYSFDVVIVMRDKGSIFTKEKIINEIGKITNKIMEN